MSKEQVAAFARLTDLEKLEWMEQARLFTLAQTPETARRHERLRKGERSELQRRGSPDDGETS